MKYVPGNAQHAGAREEQQDAFGFSDPEDKTFAAHAGILGVLADGMGGMLFGSEGSQAAVRAFLNAYSAKSPEEPVPDALKRSLIEANSEVLSMAARAGAHDEVGTTLAAAVALDDSLYWISAGDSRIYLLRDGRLTQLTRDHIYANHLDEEVARGEISKTEALNHPERDGLTSYLGLEDLIEIDRNIRPFPLQPDDRVILCSDGLYRSISEAEIASLNGDDPQRACEKMIERVLAKQVAHQDNVTVLALWRKPDAIAVKPARSRKSALLAAMLIVLIGGIGTWWWLKQPPDVNRNQQQNANQNTNAGEVNSNEPGASGDRSKEPETNANREGEKREKPTRPEGPQEQEPEQDDESNETPPADKARGSRKKSRLREPIPARLSRHKVKARSSFENRALPFPEMFIA